MTKAYNLWLEWEAYKMLHPEKRQVLEWQEQDYSRFCGRSQNRQNQLSRNTRKLKGAKHSGKEETYKTSIGV